jgi:hypothetical protein
MAAMNEPSLPREIGRVAWFMIRALLIIALITGLLFLSLWIHPVIGAWIWCGLVLIGQVVYYGWQNYQGKRSDWKRQQEQEERDRQWKASNERPRGD